MSPATKRIEARQILQNYNIMYSINCSTKLIDFLVVGFSDFPDIQTPLFLYFLSVYILTLCGNLVLVVLIIWSPSLSTPMYFFLCNLSTLDVIYTSVTGPKLISIFATNNGRISYVECILQLYFFIAFGSTEYFLLTVMSYDRYVAVCKPLYYSIIMNQQVCKSVAIGSWLGGLVASIPIASVTSTLDYCSLNLIDHFFCDVNALIHLACNDTTLLHTVILIQGVVLVMTSFILTVISYIQILCSIMRIRTSTGKYKTFSTCGSHLTVVSLFYVMVFFLYMRPSSSMSLSEAKILTTLYVYIIPLLNPVVYSFRNQSVKEALRKLPISLLKKLLAFTS
ncbi:olfactory receptor 1L4-like [Leptodactylus fuscus]|uniref:olfactory receptor 1L4-like n=1 Tax=Leptodactylus fuscus TaxID=238119 RepID=UPI003F4ED1CE